MRGRSDDDASAGAWLELAVEADPEAVEAVSEIIGRVATGGTTVEPAFELFDEGLGARIDPTRPAIMDNYWAAAGGPLKCQHDKLTRAYILDRVHAKATR